MFLHCTFIVKGILYIVSSIVFGTAWALYEYNYYKIKPSPMIKSIVRMFFAITWYNILASVTPILAMVNINAAVWYSNLSSILSITPMIYYGWQFIRESVNMNNSGSEVVDLPKVVK